MNAVQYNQNTIQNLYNILKPWCKTTVTNFAPSPQYIPFLLQVQYFNKIYILHKLCA